MRTKTWQPTKKTYDFIRTYRNLMSIAELAECLHIHPTTMRQELHGMGCRIEYYGNGGAAEVERDRWIELMDITHCRPIPPYYDDLAILHETVKKKTRTGEEPC